MFRVKFQTGGRIVVTAILSISLLIQPLAQIQAATAPKLVIDGQLIASDMAPQIIDGRTMVPIRVVSEKLGATVTWNEENKTVTIVKGDKQVVLRIDNRLVDYTQGQTTYGLSDVAPQITNSRTLVPLRLVGNALGVEVQWKENTRTVQVNSQLPPSLAVSYNLSLPGITPGQLIIGTTNLQVSFTGEVPANIAEVRYYSLDCKTGRGTVIARGANWNQIYSWLPDPTVQGQRLLGAVVYDRGGNYLAGTIFLVQMGIIPQATLAGITEGQILAGAVDLRTNSNFLAEFVKYEIANATTGKTLTTDPADPQGPFNWAPDTTDNGSTSIVAIAYDSVGQSYRSNPVKVTVQLTKEVAFRGIAANATVTKPVSLWVARNFPITQVEYILRDPANGQEEILGQYGYANHKWFPGPEKVGTWELYGRVKDTAGKIFTTNPITVKVGSTPLLLVEGVGPNQVITGLINLKSLTNVTLNNIQYSLTNTQTGAKKVIASGNSAEAELTWTPTKAEAGFYKLQAIGTTPAGQTIQSELIPLRVYMGTLYTAKPVIEKDKFQDFAGQLAVKSREKTGMSAALQTAQAILETGWGQSTPVDKYTGKLSNNLFGIKGKGTAGSVTSNTWEEYNGTAFRIDAAFRAYLSPAESWNDHKSLLLTASRYEPYRNVMHNSTQGAWALRRCGYATDSKYPTKLIDIIKRYDLNMLDEVNI